MKRRLLAALLVLPLILSLAACAGETAETTTAATPDQTSEDAGSDETEPEETESEATEPEETTAEETEGEAAADPVTIKVFSNNSDRTADQGMIEELIFAAYTDENPHVTIEVEALEDDPYKVKFKAYSAGSDMPDLVSVWGQPGFIDEVIDAGILAELNEADYADNGFVAGSLDGFSKDGKLYGLPRNTDVMVVFYNKDLFSENGWQLPETYQDFVDLSLAAKEAGSLGVGVDGQGAWSLDIYLTDLFAKFNGPGVMDKISAGIDSGDWSDPMFTDAAQLMQDSAEDVFMNGFVSTDYDTAKNMFMSGQLAMLYMGSWEMAMATSEDVEFEIGAFALPTVDGASGSGSDIAAWNGGGYSVTSDSPVKDEAIKLLNFIFQDDQWNKLAWENSVCMSAQDFSTYMTGNETPVQNEIIDIFTQANSITGTPINDMGTSQFKTNSEAAIQELATGSITVEEFYTKLIP